MKREERTLLNQLRKSVTPDTINVEIPMNYTHEGRQAIHELLTIEKGLYAPCIYWNDIQGEYCVHYERTMGDPTATATKHNQETRNIDEITAELPRYDCTWNGYPKPTEPATGTETTETTESETTEEPKEETPMFPNLTAAVNAHFDENAAKFAANLETITTGEALAGWYYRNRMTPAALRMAQETDPAEPLPVKVREKMVSRFQRENESDRQKYLHKLERAANAPELRDLTVCVEWAKSRTWGANPTATVTVNDSHHYETTGHASGCGYDKESAAIASAMNANAAVLRILYTHAEKGGKFAYSVYTFAGLPYFDGGCGVSCFRNVFEGCGYEWRDLVHRKTFDSYMMTPANA